MLFNSLLFLAFFPTVALIYAALPHRHRWVLLLLASYGFYMAWEPGYIVLIVGSTLVDYFAAHNMARARDKSHRKRWLMLSLCSNLGLLGFFKYYNFFSDTLTRVLGEPLLGHSEFLLPVGISFYTFQTLSYSIDVYRGKLQPERHLGIFALYVAFFPQLVAGPIERATHLLPQFKKVVRFNYGRITGGLKLMAWGMFKKVVIADHLAILVDQVYKTPEAFGGPELVLATIFFAFQIYCDFSGYSDIAIGAAQVLGFNLMDNFNRPYWARSIGDFWRRWHISLSTWFRDYVYLPLGGNRVAYLRWCFNVIVVFGVSGLWHGAKWTFVVWGLLHGSYMILGRVLAPLPRALRIDKIPIVSPLLAILGTFVLVNFAWIFFRASSVTEAWQVISRLGIGWENGFDLARMATVIKDGRFDVFYALGAILFLEVMQCVLGFGDRRHLLQGKPAWLRWAFYNVLILMILFGGKFGEVPFLYFQF